MELEIILDGKHCPITGIPLDDFGKVRRAKNIDHPIGYYAAEWEVKNPAPKEKQVREKRILLTPEEKRLKQKERDRRNYDPVKKHRYYLTRKAKIKYVPKSTPSR